MPVDDQPPIPDRMRHRVTWRTIASAPADGSCGQDLATPTTVGTYWAQVRTYEGQIVLNSGQQKALRRADVTMRAVGAIKAGDLLIFQGRTLVVNSVFRFMERNAYLVIKTTERGQGQSGGP